MKTSTSQPAAHPTHPVSPPAFSRVPQIWGEGWRWPPDSQPGPDSSLPRSPGPLSPQVPARVLLSPAAEAGGKPTRAGGARRHRPGGGRGGVRALRFPAPAPPPRGKSAPPASRGAATAVPNRPPPPFTSRRAPRCPRRGGGGRRHTPRAQRVSISTPRAAGVVCGARRGRGGVRGETPTPPSLPLRASRAPRGERQKGGKG